MLSISSSFRVLSSHNLRAIMHSNTEITCRRSSRLSEIESQSELSHPETTAPVVSRRRRLQSSPMSEERPTKRSKRSRSTKETTTGDSSLKRQTSSSSVPKNRKRKAEISYQPADFPSRPESEWRIGPHVSSTGGVENTIINAASIGATAFALFVKSQRKWTSPPTKPESIVSFKSRLKDFGYSTEHILPHGSYLVNMGNPDVEKRQKSYECFVDELKRCEELNLKLYNFHPGSTVGQATVEESITFIAECINKAHKETSSIVIVIENMAGAGNVIGGPYSQLGGIIERVEDKTRVGVCLDTCHMFAAGYDIRTKDGWNEMLEEFDREVDLQYLRGMHLNDSKAELGSKKDRHENIGLGHLTLSTFANIVTDPRTKHIPLILETPAFDGPGPNLGQGMDIWKKEVEILNRLSHQGDGEVDDEKLNAWTEEIRNVVREASAKKESQGGKKGKEETGLKGPGKEKTAAGRGVDRGKGKGKKQKKEKERNGGEDEDDGVSGSSGLSSMSGEE